MVAGLSDLPAPYRPQLTPGNGERIPPPPPAGNCVVCRECREWHHPLLYTRRLPPAYCPVPIDSLAATKAVDFTWRCFLHFWAEEGPG